MADITIGDFSGSVEVDIADDSLAGTQKLTSLKSASTLLSALAKPVTDPTFQDATFAATFAKPAIPFGPNTVNIKASVNNVISVARAGDSPLFGKNNYDPIEIKGNDCWVSFELDTALNLGVAIPLPQGFGVSFSTGTASAFTSHLLIPGSDAPGTTLAAAIGKATSNFQILATPELVLAAPAGAIYTSDLSGTVKVAGSWSLPLAVNQLSLADAQLPFNQSVTVNPGVTLKVGGSIAITSEFAVRIRRMSASVLRIGVYNKKGTTLTATFSAGAGVAANVGGTDLIKAFFDATAPKFDLSALSQEDGAKIQKVLNDSLDRSLSISLNASCAASDTDEAAFVYEVNTRKGSAPATKDALAKALTGDWTALASLPNATLIRNVITETIEKKITVNVNVLGLYNYRSVADFVLKMQVLTNAEDGSVVITDTSTAKRISTASTPLAADPDKLRSALYEAFLATVTYKALGAGAGFGATFSVSQDLLNYHASMDYRDALKQLNAGEILGVLPASLVASLPHTGGRVHHARFAASCSYSNDDVLRFFFTDIQAMTPRKADDLKKHARSILASLLDPQDTVDQQRIARLASDAKWAQMDAQPATIPAPFFGDWLDITQWAEAVAEVAPVLAEAIAAGKKVTGDPTADKKFMVKRDKLAMKIDGVTHNTKAAFDHTFPICVMATLAGRANGQPPAPVFEAAWDGKTLFSNRPVLAAAATLGK